MKRLASRAIVVAFVAAQFFVPGGLSAEQPAPPSDPVLDKLTEWTGIALSELKLDGAPRPHRVVTALGEVVNSLLVPTHG